MVFGCSLFQGCYLRISVSVGGRNGFPWGLKEGPLGEVMFKLGPKGYEGMAV